jgi:hypothetical protein
MFAILTQGSLAVPENTRHGSSALETPQRLATWGVFCRFEARPCGFQANLLEA